MFSEVPVEYRFSSSVVQLEVTGEEEEEEEWVRRGSDAQM